ncbi:MAG: hypothetical protein Q9221_008227 [Calogaya cf. arnoldii]
MGLLQIVLPAVRSCFIDEVAAQETNKHSIVHMRMVYAVMLVIAHVTRISTWTISISTALFPSIFATEAKSLLRPSSVFLPAAATPSAMVPSIAAGAFQLLQCDEIIGAAAMVLWSTTLYITAMDRKGPRNWASLVTKGIVIEALAGPLGFAVAAVWARYELIFATDNEEKKSR